MFENNDDDWLTLITAMRQGRVIPVIGPDAVTFPPLTEGGRTNTLYGLVANKLAQEFKQPLLAEAESTWGLHHQVSHLLGTSEANPDKLRRRVAKVLGELASRDGPLAKTAQPVLSALASIDAFEVYLSLSIDDLLLRSLKDVDPNATNRFFGIRSDTNSREIDIPQSTSGKLVYQLFGSTEHLLDFAIHEGDVLEYLFKLQGEQGRTAQNVLGRLRTSHLLFIGCGLPDWFGRHLLRLVNGNALSAKETHEFMEGSNTAASLTSFILRFSPITRLFDGSTEEFVTELAARWNEAKPKDKTAPQDRLPHPTQTPSMAGKTVFISYASENVVAARSIAERLILLGAKDVWFDKRRLRGGDDWSFRINEAIDECDYFLPLLSSEADSRNEGVYREEWALALARSSRMADAFIIPIVIDHHAKTSENYQRIGKAKETKRFFKFHILNAPLGVLSNEAEQDLIARLNPLRVR